MEKFNLDKKNLKSFGITMGFALLIIAILILARHRHNPAPVVLASFVFFTLGLFAPFLLKPAYKAWMEFAFLLGWFNTRLILIMIFYLILTPIGLAMRLCKKDLLDRKIEKNKCSYWKEKEKQAFGRLNYERQF
jgi:multisubunit Na+/H+ antiporter MnhG subunit